MTSEMLHKLRKLVDAFVWEYDPTAGSTINQRKLKKAAKDWLMENGCKVHKMWVAVQVLKPDQVMIPTLWGCDEYTNYAPCKDSYLLIPRELADKILVLGALPEFPEEAAS